MLKMKQNEVHIDAKSISKQATNSNTKTVRAKWRINTFLLSFLYILICDVDDISSYFVIESGLGTIS